MFIFTLILINYLNPMDWNTRIFNEQSTESFKELSLEIFHFQVKNNPVYKNYLHYLGVDTVSITQIEDIPYLPIELFKSHEVICEPNNREAFYTSSGTGGIQSKHIVHDLSIYEDSFIKGFEYFYGDIKEYAVLALLPSYMERTGSSLIYMCEKLIQLSKNEESGFYLNEHELLFETLKKLESQSKKTLLIGVSFGLLDFTENYSLDLKNTVVMETGGMKGRRKEMIRQELHRILGKGFRVQKIHSEYGMTELLSQAYSQGNSLFKCPPWMQVSCRDTNDPLSINKTKGGLNVIDLANVHSCSFIATQDLGRIHENGDFEVLGRFDTSDIRGCNLMVL
jgi:phenylacetate-coenzyme A ligase PaaK-like adenylate-forming protein